MTTTNRVQRVAEEIHQILANMLLFDTKDPRFKQVTLSAVDVSSDFSAAKVFVTILHQDLSQDPVVEEEIVTALNKASGYFRSQLAKQLKLRTVPKLNFRFDTSMQYGNRISELIDSVRPKSDT